MAKTGNANWSKAQATERQRIVAELCKQRPKDAARALGRILHREHPLYFKSVDAGRSDVRRYFGQHGDASRHRAKAPRPARKPGEMTPLPPSHAKPRKPYILEGRRILVLSDIHIPYQDNDALELALAYGETFRPNTILINGDLFDFYKLSHFAKNPTATSIKEELALGKVFLSHLSDRFPRVRKVFKLGNHDERWYKYLESEAPEISDIDEIKEGWQKACGILANKVEVVGDQRAVMAGKLRILHGHEKGRGISSPVNQARGAFLRLLSSVLEGHGHRSSEHTERTADGNTIVCRSTGCLCGLDPEYAPYNKWDHGFATVEVAKDGSYEVELKKIINGKVR